MEERRKKSWKKRFLHVLFIVGAGWSVYSMAMNLMIWHFARELSQEYPDLGIVPTLLNDTRVEELTGQRVEKFGFSFQVPWNDFEWDQTVRNVAMVRFKDGASLLIFDPAIENGVKILRGDTAHNLQLMTSIFGSKTLSSNNELITAEAQSVPSDVSWWNGRSRNARNLILLVNKSANLHRAKVIYKVGSGKMRGFQYGDPAVAPFLVTLDVFDEADHHYKILISTRNKNPCITQAQINGLIASLRPLGA